jgi:hypothetical protein
MPALSDLPYPPTCPMNAFAPTFERYRMIIVSPAAPIRIEKAMLFQPYWQRR